MIDNPENGHKAQMRDKETDATQDFQTATVVAEPDAQTIRPELPVEAPGNQSAATAGPLPSPTRSSSEVEFSSELTRLREKFEQIQAGFIGEPRATVDKAEMLIGGLINMLHDQLQRIHGGVKTETDTEQLRMAMLSYRKLFDSLVGDRASNPDYREGGPATQIQ